MKFFNFACSAALKAFGLFNLSIFVLGATAAMNMESDISDSKAPLLTTATITSEIIPTAHEMSHLHGLPIINQSLTPAERMYWENYNTTTYFTLDIPNKSALWIHVCTILLSIILLYPVSLCLNNIDSKWFLPALTVNLIDTVISIISLKVFSESAPNLYPGSVYGKLTWILLFSIIAHYFFAILSTASKWINRGIFMDDEGEEALSSLAQPFIPLEEYTKPSTPHEIDVERFGAQSPSTLIDGSNSSDNHKSISENTNVSPAETKLPNTQDLAPFDAEDYSNFQHWPRNNRKSYSAMQRDSVLSKLFKSKFISKTAPRLERVSSILFNFLNYPILIYLFIYIVTGLTVGNLCGKEHRIFNILAHFIKGGVFIMLGALSLGRYCGALSKYGLAWNKCIVFKNQVDTNSFWYKITPHGLITMEGYESFLIFFYGTTNVFLEHLGAGPDNAWTPKDLQHASIAFMYIGSGLCGIITEALLSDWRFKHTLLNTNINSSAIHAGSPGYSPNPFPVFTIFWTGILMSQHEQASVTSTNVHVQWGYLLSYGSFFRLFTFILLMLTPNRSLTPARPFTELITSFCLICGGFIFMQSTDQAVEALEYRGLTSMFTLNVNVGVVTILMGWEMCLLIWKNWLKNRQQI